MGTDEKPSGVSLSQETKTGCAGGGVICIVVGLNIFLLLFFAVTQNTFGQTSNNRLDLCKASGFIMGQRLSLNHIKTEYPSLSLQVKKVELEFQAAFGTAEKNIEKSLRDLLNDEYNEYNVTVKEQMQSNLQSQRISKEIALQYLDAVESRAKGQIASPILETLLHYQFEEKPAEEFIRGYKKTYRTKEHPKAKGLDLQIDYPISWSLREGKRPNIIQFFSSGNGNGPAYTEILIRNITKEAQGELTNEEIRALASLEGCKELASELFSESSLRDMVEGMGFANLRIITSKRVVLDNWPGAMIECIGDKQRLDFTFTMYNKMYYALYKNYLIFLSFQVSKLPDDTTDLLKARFSKFDPLFQLMANSLVIQSQY